MAEKFYNKGMELFKEEKFKGALRNFNKAVKKNADFDLAWEQRGSALIRLKRYEEANETFDKALKLDSSKADRWMAKIGALVYIGTYEECIKCCNEALKLEPNRWWTQTAWVDERFKNYEEALKCIEKAINYSSSIHEKFEFLEKSKSAILSGFKYGKHFYIPVSSSYLLTLIPLGTEIIYSTECYITHIKKWTRYGNIYDKWNLPVFFTRDGVACMVPAYKIIPWFAVKFKKRGFKVWWLKDIHDFKYSLRRNPYFESEESFKVREKNFRNDISELISPIKV